MKIKHIHLEEIKTKSDMILDVHDLPDWKTWLVFAFQHILAMFGATVLTPVIINGMIGRNVIGVDVTLFSSGVGTLIYIALTKAKVPIYLGSSFAYVGAMGALYPIYGTSMFFGLFGVGIVYATVSTLIYFFGTGWLKKLLPPVVVGPMIMVIGLGLAPIAVNSIGLTQDADVNWWGVLVAMITTFTAMLVSLCFTGKTKLMAIIIAMGVGLASAMIINTWLKGSQKLVDYSAINWKDVETYIGLPDFSNSIFSGNPGYVLNEIKDPITGVITEKWEKAKWSIMPLFLMMPIAFATIAEHIGDHTVLGKITGRDYINGKPGLHRTLLGDGFATAFAGLAGAPANTSYGENTTAVGMSKVASVYVTGLAAVFAVLMSFIKIIPTVFSLMPPQVSGGLGLVLYGFIASNGFKVLMEEKVDLSQARNIFIISGMLIFGLGGAALDFTIGSTEIAFAGTSLAMFFGMILSGILPKDRGIDLSKMPQPSEELKNKFKNRKNKVDKKEK